VHRRSDRVLLEQYALGGVMGYLWEIGANGTKCVRVLLVL
jgi:hypothetical protein